MPRKRNTTSPFVEVRNGKPIFRVSKTRGEATRDVISNQDYLILFLRLYLVDYITLCTLNINLLKSRKLPPKGVSHEQREELVKELYERRHHARMDLRDLNKRKGR